MTTCPLCKNQATWIPAYQRWYCYSCSEYLPEETPPPVYKKEYPIYTAKEEPVIKKEEPIIISENGVFASIKNSFKANREFIKSVKKEKGYKKVMKILLPLILLTTSINTLLFAQSIINLANQYLGSLRILPQIEFIINLVSYTPLMFIAILILMPLIMLLGVFILSLLNHALFKIFKGRGSYNDTFKLVGYSLIPLFVSSVAPIIGIVIGAIFSLRYYYISGLITHEIPKIRVISVIIITLSILLLPLLLINLLL